MKHWSEDKDDFLGEELFLYLVGELHFELKAFHLVGVFVVEWLNGDEMGRVRASLEPHAEPVPARAASRHDLKAMSQKLSAPMRFFNKFKYKSLIRAWDSNCLR